MRRERAFITEQVHCLGCASTHTGSCTTLSQRHSDKLKRYQYFSSGTCYLHKLSLQIGNKRTSLIIYLCSSRRLFAISAVAMMDYIKALSEWEEHSYRNTLKCVLQCKPLSFHGVEQKAKLCSVSGKAVMCTVRYIRNESHCQQASNFKRRKMDNNFWRDLRSHIFYLSFTLPEHQISP